jgi:hypothetical protein
MTASKPFSIALDRATEGGWLGSVRPGKVWFVPIISFWPNFTISSELFFRYSRVSFLCFFSIGRPDYVNSRGRLLRLLSFKNFRKLPTSPSSKTRPSRQKRKRKSPSFKGSFSTFISFFSEKKFRETFVGITKKSPFRASYFGISLSYYQEQICRLNLDY